MIKQALIEYVDPELINYEFFQKANVARKFLGKLFSPLARLNEIDESDIYPLD